MDNVILDVVLGLVLTYAVLALLVTSIQEALAGWLIKTRVNNLHDLLCEATGRDAALKQRVLRNPLVYALYDERTATQRWWRSSGPSEIPPDVFTRALLVELDPLGGGKAPSELHATPQAFVDALSAKGLDRDSAGPHRVVRVLRSLLPGRETSWADFEAAIATWFSHIGDRSKGWFKRRSLRWSFLISLLLAAGLDVDSLHIARALAGDPEVRAGVARLAERVAAEREDPSATAAPAPAEPLRPEARVSARLVDAYNRLRPLYFHDDDIADFGHRLGPVSRTCRDLVDEPASPAAKGDRSGTMAQRFVSDSATWIELLPPLQTRIELLLAGSADLLPTPGATACPAKAASKPSARNRCETADPPPTTTAAGQLRNAHACLTHLSSWVRAATTASKDAAAQRTMQEASAALEDAKAALLTLVQQRGVPLSLRRLFLAAPEGFSDCLKQQASLDAVRRCTEANLDASARLPIGYSDYNRLQQFCAIRTASGPKALEQLKQQSRPGLFGECDADTEGHSVDANAQLGIDAMVLSSRGAAAYASWAAGLLITTIMAMLGAPFWFDLLGKVANIRAAGRRSDDAEAAAKGTGTMSLLPPPLPAPAPASPATGPAVPPDPATGSGEVPLTRREVIALQQRIGVVPATGVLDAATRLKLKAALADAGLGSSDRITAAAYLALVGRAAVGGQPLVVGSMARPMRGQPYAAAQALARNLTDRLGLAAERPQLVPPTVGDFNDDLRALAVLYRFKQASPQDHTAPVFQLASDNPAALDQIDELLLNELLVPSTTTHARHSAPWLDWAIGELGQVEAGADNAKASNPRIVAYLDSLAPPLGKSGDRTPWCGAFVAWVVQRHNAFVPAGGSALAAPPADAASAESWAAWAGATPGAVPAPGDVVVVKTRQSRSGFHVGFCFEVVGNDVYLLGGNQTGGSRVSLSKFQLPVHAARRSP